MAIIKLSAKLKNPLERSQNHLKNFLNVKVAMNPLQRILSLQKVLSYPATHFLAIKIEGNPVRFCD